MTTAEELRAQHAVTWDAAVGHRFVDLLWAGALPAPVLVTYLVQDHAFVDGFLALMGAAVASADRADARRVHARQLGIVAGPEGDFFSRAFDALDVPPAERTEPVLLDPTREFAALMDTARRSGEYAVQLAVLTVAEWLYLDWGSRDAALPDEPVHREWIELHRGPEFVAWVDFLRAELDRVVPGLDGEGRGRVEAAFGRAVELELAFFEATCPA